MPQRPEERLIEKVQKQSKEITDWLYAEHLIISWYLSEKNSKIWNFYILPLQGIIQGWNSCLLKAGNELFSEGGRKGERD